jgi:transcription termination factor Rho
MLAKSDDAIEATESLIKLLKRTPNNEAFLETIAQRSKATV